MHPLAIALAVTSAAIHAWREMLTKQANDKQIFVWWYEIWSLLFFFPIAAYFTWKSGISWQGIGFGALSGIVHFFYWFFLSKSYESGDLSHVYPIMRSSPALVLIFSVLVLGEQVSGMGVAGVITIMAGIYVINMKRISMQGFLEPIFSLKERPTQYALLTSLTVAGYSLTDKLGVDHLHPLIFIYVIVIVSMSLFTPYVLLTKTHSAIASEWKAHKRMIVMNGFLVGFGYALILIAFTFERVSYVTAMRQLSIVFGVLLGGHLLLEKHKNIRLSGAALIFLGAVLIAMAS